MMTYTIGDKPFLSGTIAAVLTNADFTVNVRRPDGTTVTAAGIVIDGPTGAWAAEFADGELNQPGWNAIELRVLFAGETLPQTFALDPDDVPMGFMARQPLAA